MAPEILNQVLTGAHLGDAITDQALLIRRWLREFGFKSEIYAEHVEQSLQTEIRPFAGYRPGRGEEWLVLHHSFGSSLVDDVRRLGQKLILIYHNVTPAGLFGAVDPDVARRLELGRRQLPALRDSTALALADSPYGELELRAAGFAGVATLPIALNPERYDLPLSKEIPASLAGGEPVLLFVGRLAPNKKQEDLIKLLYFYHRIEPAARLVLVGSPWLPGYERWLRRLAGRLGLGDAVIMTGQVSQGELVSYYRSATLYVSMSEHEGFGKPFIESMYLGLPVLAYRAAAVPYTMGQAGLLFREKSYEALAELIAILLEDEALRQRLVDRQKSHVQRYLEPQVRAVWSRCLADLGVLG